MTSPVLSTPLWPPVETSSEMLYALIRQVGLPSGSPPLKPSEVLLESIVSGSRVKIFHTRRSNTKIVVSLSGPGPLGPLSRKLFPVTRLFSFTHQAHRGMCPLAVVWLIFTGPLQGSAFWGIFKLSIKCYPSASRTPEKLISVGVQPPSPPRTMLDTLPFAQVPKLPDSPFT